jgi:UDP-2,3-diacylglucosamine hydrolase
MIEIKEGALFIADAHYPHHGNAFFQILKKIERKELHASQIFLMGDIFDLLFGYNDYIKQPLSGTIALVEKLSKKHEIYYFEGNHDFCLETIFSNIKIYNRASQPVYMGLEGKKVGISHGDIYEAGFWYGVYSFLLRNKVALTLLKPFQKKIIDHRLAKLKEKNICAKIEYFEQKAKAISEHYQKDTNLIIEGHFHQAKKLGRYISLPSLACQEQVGAVIDGEIHFIDIKDL